MHILIILTPPLRHLSSLPKEHGQVDTSIVVPLFEFEGVRLMKERRVEQNHAIAAVWDLDGPVAFLCHVGLQPRPLGRIIVIREFPIGRCCYLVDDQTLMQHKRSTAGKPHASEHLQM